MDKIKAELTAISEKYKKEYSDNFDKAQRLSALRKNVMSVADLQLKLAEELAATTKRYYKTHNIVDTSDVDQYRNDLYMSFIQFSTTFE